MTDSYKYHEPQSAWGIYTQFTPRPQIAKFNRALSALEKSGVIGRTFTSSGIFVYQLQGQDQPANTQQLVVSR